MDRNIWGRILNMLKLNIWQRYFFVELSLFNFSWKRQLILVFRTMLTPTARPDTWTRRRNCIGGAWDWGRGRPGLISTSVHCCIYEANWRKPRPSTRRPGGWGRATRARGQTSRGCTTSCARGTSPSPDLQTSESDPEASRLWILASDLISSQRLREHQHHQTCYLAVIFFKKVIYQIICK